MGHSVYGSLGVRRLSAFAMLRNATPGFITSLLPSIRLNGTARLSLSERILEKFYVLCVTEIYRGNVILVRTGRKYRAL